MKKNEGKNTLQYDAILQSTELANNTVFHINTGTQCTIMHVRVYHVLIHYFSVELKMFVVLQPIY